MRLLTIFVLIIALVFINLGDTLLPSSLGRFSKKTRSFINKLTLEITIPEKEEASQVSEKTPTKRQKTVTDIYFEKALEEAERQTHATDEYFEQSSEEAKRSGRP